MSNDETPVSETPMDEPLALDGGLEVAHRVRDEIGIVRISGPLTFPDAVAVSAVVQHVVEQQPPVLILDLTEIRDVDATGIAVLVATGRDLKDAGIQVRIVASDPRIRHRLPYTLGLRKVFATVDQALEYRP